MSSATDSARPADAQVQTEISDTDVLILGASFIGLELLHQLRRRPQGRGLRVTIIDRHRRHGYLPLVHERLCGRLAPGESEIDTAAAIEADVDACFIQGEIVAVDTFSKEVLLASGQNLHGRFLVIALGSVLEPPPAIPGSQHLVRYKLADEQESATAALADLLGPDSPTGDDAEAPTVAVIGGGISGVELAGELAHLASERPPAWRAPKVVLVHSGERLLPRFAARVARRASRILQQQGVEIRLDTRLLAAKPGQIRLRDAQGERWQKSNMCFWSGGIRPAPLLASLNLPRTEAGWLAVGPTLQCFATPRPTMPDVFAGGDAVRVIGDGGEWPTMQRAIECIWQANVIARNIIKLSEETESYLSGVPPLEPHRLRKDFFHGISLGGRSLVVYGRAMVDVAGVNTWFRRFLMRSYFARYRK